MRSEQFERQFYLPAQIDEHSILAVSGLNWTSVHWFTEFADVS
jgi:hypothetical protein